MKLAYIAGKYRGKTEDEIYEHIYLARKQAKILLKMGYAYICPHMNTAFMGGCTAHNDDDVFLKIDMEILSRCDCIVMLPNWRESAGARQELNFAMARGMMVFFAGMDDEEMETFAQSAGGGVNYAVYGTAGRDDDSLN